MTEPHRKDHAGPRSWIADIVARPVKPDPPVLRTHRWVEDEPRHRECLVCEVGIWDTYVEDKVGVQVVTDLARDIATFFATQDAPTGYLAHEVTKCPRTT